MLAPLPPTNNPYPNPNQYTMVPAAAKQELDATAVYHGLATKHPLIPKLARQMRNRERGGLASNGNDLGMGDHGDRGVSAPGRRSSGGGRRGSEMSRSSTDKGRRTSKVRTCVRCAGGASVLVLALGVSLSLSCIHVPPDVGVGTLDPDVALHAKGRIQNQESRNSRDGAVGISDLHLGLAGRKRLSFGCRGRSDV